MKNLFTRAWEIAKLGQAQFGGSSKEYFAQALKQAWSEKKNIKSIIEVPAWIVRKNVGNVELAQSSALGVIRETEKAVLIEANGKYGTFTFWSPKSVLNTQNVTDYSTANVVVEDTFGKALVRHDQLVEEAKALGIKGIRQNMKSDTLRRKIKEYKGVA